MINIFDDFQVDDLTFSLLRQPKVEKGIYPYKIKSITKEDKVPTAFGVKDKVVITYSIDYKGSVVDVVDKLNVSKGSESRLMKFITQLCKAYSVNKINLMELIGTEGNVEIENVSDEAGNVFERVVNVMPVVKTE